MTTFWELFKNSIIVQSLVTLMFCAAVVYMYVTGQEVPADLINIMLLILGFWFGTKVQGTVNEQQMRKVVTEAKYDGTRKA